jgi:hypothetical protein
MSDFDGSGAYDPSGSGYNVSLPQAGAQGDPREAMLKKFMMMRQMFGGMGGGMGGGMQGGPQGGGGFVGGLGSGLGSGMSSAMNGLMLKKMMGGG